MGRLYATAAAGVYYGGVLYNIAPRLKVYMHKHFRRRKQHEDNVSSTLTIYYNTLNKWYLTIEALRTYKCYTSSEHMNHFGETSKTRQSTDVYTLTLKFFN